MVRLTTQRIRKPIIAISNGLKQRIADRMADCIGIVSLLEATGAVPDMLRQLSRCHLQFITIPFFELGRCCSVSRHFRIVEGAFVLGILRQENEAKTMGIFSLLRTGEYPIEDDDPEFRRLFE